MAKHSKKQNRRKIIQLKDHQPESLREEETPEEAPKAAVEYDGEPEEEAGQKMGWQAPKAFYRAAVVLVVLVLGLALWVNRESLTPENIWSWVQTQVMGAQGGDGYPVSITGSNVSQGNFTSYGGNAVVLSDTAFTVLGPSGQEVFSQRHSLNQPVLKEAAGNYLLYNQGSTGYLIASGTEVRLEDSAGQDILAGAVAANGRFALATQGKEGASDLTVYLETGEVQFTYSFAQDYITSLALSADGTSGIVCTVRSQGGELVSKVTVFQFDQADPVTQYESRDNLLLGASWGENGMLYAVGDSSLLWARASDLAFSEYSYQGRSPTAFRLEGGQAYVSISAYEHAGASTLLVFRNAGDPVEIQAEARIQALSVSGGTVGALIGQELVLYDASTGSELARADAGSDAQSIALSSESNAYVLGVSEVRRIQVR